MAGIRSKDTKPELTLRRALHARGLRYRLHDRKLPGKPDIVLRRYKAAIFVHGCFWHRHEGCRYTTIPATRTEFWEEKFRANVLRDQRNLKLLRDAGWRVAIIWECDLKNYAPNVVASEINDWLQQTTPHQQTRAHGDDFVILWSQNET